MNGFLGFDDMGISGCKLMKEYVFDKKIVSILLVKLWDL